MANGKVLQVIYYETCLVLLLCVFSQVIKLLSHVIKHKWAKGLSKKKVLRGLAGTENKNGSK